MTTGRQRLLALLILSLTITLGWFAYAPALGGALLFDDVSNLSGLAQVQDRVSALIFMFSGDAGPIGRPLTLATFVPQAAAWGLAAEPFLRVNILIHLANSCLLTWVLYQLSLASRLRPEKALFVALAAAAIWLFMPLLASSSLMIVQRMTTLCATFMLVGLAGYLSARQTIEANPTRSLVWMSASLIIGTTLAVLAKESGALLPTYVLALEATVLTTPASVTRSRWQTWKVLFLLLPTVAILAYLALRVPYSHEMILRRDFTGWERLLTEARILWQYIFNAFVPQPGEFGPFHDGYPVARALLDPVTMLAVFGWAVTCILAVLWRRRHPLFAVAVLWFLGGHLLESTLIPLELYFEHRNYVPIIGPIFALCAILAQVPMPRLRLVYVGISAYILINALVLFSHTTLWGNPPAAARYWEEHFPESVRAATTAARYRLTVGGLQGTLDALHRLAAENPAAGFVKIPELSLSCINAPQADHSEIVSDLKRVLENSDFNYTVGTMLSELFTTVNRVDCNGVDSGTVRTLANTLLNNRRYKDDARYNQLHHQLLARILRHEGQFDQAIWHLEQAIAYGPSPDLNMMMVTTYADAKDFDAARAFIEDARRNHPWQPMKRFVWSVRLDVLSKYIDELARKSMHGG